MRIFGPRAQIALLGLVGAYFLVWPLWRIPYPLEIAPNEGWNAYFADAAAGGGALYPAPGSLIVNNYPPLSFYLLGYAEKLFGDALYLGRILSLLATLVTGALIYRVVRQLGAGPWAAVVAGIWFAATMAGSLSRYVGMDDPQIVAELIMVTAFSWFLARDHEGKSVAPAILLMVVAGFYKHNAVAIPATVLVWLLIRDGRRAWSAWAIGIGAAILGLAICYALYGPDFFANLLTPRPYRLARAYSGLGRLQWIIPALAVAVVWMANAWREPLARFLMLYTGIGLASYLLQWTGEDVLDSAQFDLVIAAAIGVGIALDHASETRLARRFGVEKVRAWAMLLLIGRIAASLHVEPMLLLADPAYRAAFETNAAVARAEAAQLAAMPGPIACSNKIVCRMAGKPFVYDDFRMDMILALEVPARTAPQDILRQHGLAFFESDPRTTTSSLERVLLKRR